MLIYLVVFSISILSMMHAEGHSFQGKYSRIEVLFALLIPSLLAGLRHYSIGTDTSLYVNIWFENASKATDFLAFIIKAGAYSIAFGYAALNFIVSRFTNDPHYFYFLICFIELTILFFAIKPFRKYVSTSLAFIIYFLLYFNDSLNNMRQFPALLIVLFSFRFIKDRKLIFFVITVIIAMLFHPTAFIALSLYPMSLLAEGKGRKIYIYLLGIAVLVAICSIDKVFALLSSHGYDLVRYEKYLNGQDETGGRFIRLIIYGANYLFFASNRVKFRNRVSKDMQVNTLYYYCVISTIMTALPFIISSKFIIRIAYYYDFFEIIYLPGLLNTSFYVKRNGKYGAKAIGVFVVLFIYWIIVYVVRNGANTIPYKFFWQ